MKRPKVTDNARVWREYAEKLEEDMRKIKLIMSFAEENKGALEAHYEYSFYDEELTKINWVK